MKKLIVTSLLALYVLPAWADIHSDSNSSSHNLNINGNIKAHHVYQAKPVRYCSYCGFPAPSKHNKIKLDIAIKSLGHPSHTWDY